MNEQPPNPSQVPHVYANGLGLAYTKTECAVTFVCNGEMVVTIMMPFSVGKSLADGLKKMIETFEERTKTTVPKIEEILANETRTE